MRRPRPPPTTLTTQPHQQLNKDKEINNEH